MMSVAIDCVSVCTDCVSVCVRIAYAVRFTVCVRITYAVRFTVCVRIRVTISVTVLRASAKQRNQHEQTARNGRKHIQVQHGMNCQPAQDRLSNL